MYGIGWGGCGQLVSAYHGVVLLTLSLSDAYCGGCG